MERVGEIQARPNARIAGLFYLLTFLSGAPLIGVSSRLFVPGDAAATATNILAHEALFLVGFVSELLMLASYVVVTALFYGLFKPVNRSVSLVAAFFSIVGVAVQAAGSVFYVAPSIVLAGAPYLKVFDAERLQALAFMFLKLHAQAFNGGLVFFGFYCLLIGYLIFNSTFLPRILGVLMAFAGMGWLTFLLPPLANQLSPYILAPGILGEGSLTLWLLLKGVDVRRWHEQARSAGGPAQVAHSTLV